MAREAEESVPPPQINAVRQPSGDNNTLLCAIQDLTRQVSQLSTATTGRDPNPNANGGRQPQDGDGIPSTNPRTGRPYRRYCWTHGCCNHWGRHCNNKKNGHQDAATFANRMGGSNKNCLPNPQNG